ncbi:unnamed protein product, partial [Polarella glacialis]
MSAKTFTGLALLRFQLDTHELCREYIVVCVNPLDVRETLVSKRLTTDKRSMKTSVSETGSPASTSLKCQAHCWPQQDPDNLDTLLVIKILTGRHHQIRAHLTHLEHPPVGDGKYGQSKVLLKDDHLFGDMTWFEQYFRRPVVPLFLESGPNRTQSDKSNKLLANLSDRARTDSEEVLSRRVPGQFDNPWDQATLQAFFAVRSANWSAVSDILREISELPDGEVEGEIEWADAILSPSSEQFTGGLSVAQGSSAEGQSGSDSDDGEVSEFGNLPLSVAPKSLVTGLASDSEEGSSSCDNEPPPPRVGEAGSGRAKQGSSVQVEWLDSDDSVASSSDSEESRGTTQAVATEALVLPGAHVQGFRVQDRVSDHGLSAEVPDASETFWSDPPIQRIVLARELELVVPAALPQENDRSVAVLVGDSGLPEATEEEFGGCQRGKEEMLEMTGHPALGLAQREEQLPPTSSSAAERAGAVDATDLAHEERSSTPLELLGPSCITANDPVPPSSPALSDDEAYDEALEHASELEADLSPPGLRSLQRGSSLADEMAQVGSSELLTTQAVATETSVLPGAHVQGFRVQETVSDHGLSVEVPAASETFLEDPPTQRIVLARESELVVPAAAPQENERSVAVLVGGSGLPEAAPASERAGAVDATDLAHEERSSTSLGLLDPSCATVKDPVPVSLPALSDDEADDEDLEHASEREAPGEHAEEELSPPGLRSLQRGSILADEMAQVGSSELLTTQALATEASVLPGAHVQGFRVQETVSDHGLSVEVPAASETFLEDPRTQRIVLARELELAVPVAPPQENERSVAVLVGDSGLPEGKEEEVGGCHGGKEEMLENLGLAQPGAGAVDATDLAHEKRSSTPLELLGPSCITANDPVPPSSPALSDDEADDEDLEHASELEASLSPPGLRSLQRGSSLADEMAQVGSSELLCGRSSLDKEQDKATESDSDEESRAETTRSEDIFVRSARENVREAGETSQGVVSGLRAESSGLDDQAGVEDNSRECKTTGLAEASNPVPASLACDEGEVSPSIPLEPELSEALEADVQKWPPPMQGATFEASERVRSREKYIAELEDRLQAGEADAGRQQDLCTQLQQLSEAQRRRLSDAEEERDSLLLRLTEVEEMAERRGRTQQRLLDEARRRAAAAEDEHDLLQQQLVEAVEAKAQLQKLRSQMESLRRQLAAGEQAQEDMAEKLATSEEAVQRQNELLLNAMSEISELEEQQGTEAPLFSPLQRHSPRALSLKARGEEHLRDDPVHAEGQTAVASEAADEAAAIDFLNDLRTLHQQRLRSRLRDPLLRAAFGTLRGPMAEEALEDSGKLWSGKRPSPCPACRMREEQRASRCSGRFSRTPRMPAPNTSAGGSSPSGRAYARSSSPSGRPRVSRSARASDSAGDMTSAAASFGGTSRRWDGDSGVLLASPPREGHKQEQRTCAAFALRMAMQTAAIDSGGVNCSPDRRRGDMCFQRWDVIGDERERFDKSPLTHWDSASPSVHLDSFQDFRESFGRLKSFLHGESVRFSAMALRCPRPVLLLLVLFSFLALRALGEQSLRGAAQDRADSSETDQVADKVEEKKEEAPAEEKKEEKPAEEKKKEAPADAKKEEENGDGDGDGEAAEQKQAAAQHTEQQEVGKMMAELAEAVKKEAGAEANENASTQQRHGEVAKLEAQLAAFKKNEANAMQDMKQKESESEAEEAKAEQEEAAAKQAQKEEAAKAEAEVSNAKKGEAAAQHTAQEEVEKAQEKVVEAEKEKTAAQKAASEAKAEVAEAQEAESSAEYYEQQGAAAAKAEVAKAKRDEASADNATQKEAAELQASEKEEAAAKHAEQAGATQAKAEVEAAEQKEATAEKAEQTAEKDEAQAKYAEQEVVAKAKSEVADAQKEKAVAQHDEQDEAADAKWEVEAEKKKVAAIVQSEHNQSAKANAEVIAVEKKEAAAEHAEKEEAADAKWEVETAQKDEAEAKNAEKEVVAKAKSVVAEAQKEKAAAQHDQQEEAADAKKEVESQKNKVAAIVRSEHNQTAKANAEVSAAEKKEAAAEQAEKEGAADAKWEVETAEKKEAAAEHAEKEGAADAKWEVETAEKKEAGAEHAEKEEASEAKAEVEAEKKKVAAILQSEHNQTAK